MFRRVIFLVLAAVAAVAITASAGSAATAPKRLVKVGDNFFACKGCKASGTVRTTLKVKSKTTVVWKWGAANTDSHDVALLKTHPRGVKRFRSEIYSTDATYRKKLVKRGTYKFWCSLHPDVMRMTIVVR